MKVMIKEVGKAPYIKEYEGEYLGLEPLQEAVGGLIEHLTITDTVDLWLNDMGKLIPLPTNFFLSYNGKIYDSIQGDVMFTSHDDEGNTTGLSDEDEKTVWDMYDRMILCHDPMIDDGRIDLYPVIELGGEDDD